MPRVTSSSLTAYPFARTSASATEVRRQYREYSPLDRLGTPGEVANCVLFLASGKSSFVTGSALVVDGGSTA